GGDTDWSNVLSNIQRICKTADFPVVVKETGCGISGDAGKKLEMAGAACLDVGGAGGTSWTKVEHYMGSKTAESFSEWGLPTAESLRQCKEAVKIPLIASGGIRTGVECAKALAMGASLAGFALPLVKPAMESHKAVSKVLRELAQELKKAMFLVGARNIRELKKTKVLSVSS
ncbi:MAG: alpha-hydroxy-acid oxidizing protein, partial [Desulfatiglandales bacterium]